IDGPAGWFQLLRLRKLKQQTTIWNAAPSRSMTRADPAARLLVTRRRRAGRSRVQMRAAAATSDRRFGSYGGRGTSRLAWPLPPGTTAPQLWLTRRGKANGQRSEDGGQRARSQRLSC